MFKKKFALVLTTIHAWLVAVVAVIVALYALFGSADYYYDFAEKVGFALGVLLVGFIYCSIWYLIIYVIRNSIERK